METDKADLRRIERLKLPNVKMCIKNTKPLSLITLNSTGSVNNDDDFDSSNLGDRETRLKKLYRELYLYDLLYRMIKFNIWNKKNILVMQDFYFHRDESGTGKENGLLNCLVNSTFSTGSARSSGEPSLVKVSTHNDKKHSGPVGIYSKKDGKVGKDAHRAAKEINKNRDRSKKKESGKLGMVKALIKALITNNNVELNYNLGINTAKRKNGEDELSPETDPLALMQVEDNLFNNVGNFGLNLSRNSILKSYNTRGYPPREACSKSENKKRQEIMYNNLMSGLTCSGGQPTPARKLLLAIIHVNRYDYLPPKFINMILNKYRYLLETPTTKPEVVGDQDGNG